MNIWEKIQEDLKKNLQEGLEIFREGSSVVSEKLEKLTGEGKKKYKVFNLNMKLQEEFTKLGAEVYELISKDSASPLGNPKVKSILTVIKKLDSQINKTEKKEEKKTVKTAAKKKTAVKKKTAAKKKTTAKKKALAKKKIAVKKTTSKSNSAKETLKS